MEYEQIKSNERVKNYGEVFTPPKTVNKMLNLSGIKEHTELLTSTFLEPSAGEGAFLTELLHRKMIVAFEDSSTLEEYEDNCLIALSTLYGIELMEDNVEMLVMKMNDVFQRCYREGLSKFFGKENMDVVRSAMVIIQANMVQGNTLTKLDGNGNPLIFSEWKLPPKKKGKRQMVQRLEYTFQEIIDGSDESAGKLNHEGTTVVKEYSLFDFDYEGNKFPDDEDEIDKKISYVPVRITEVYKKLNKVE